MIHGLRKKESGGMIRIATKKVGNCVQISITDNGVGFDPNILEHSESIGLKNLKERIRIMANGSMTIKSAPGQGTETVITIPLA